MYKLMVLVSMMLRQFYIPNPFEALGEGLTIFVYECPILLQPDLLNWIAEPFLHIFTFVVVGIYYKKGSAPALGSFLYLLFYCIHNLLIWLMSVAGFATVAVIIVIMLYVGCHIGIAQLRGKIKRYANF